MTLNFAITYLLVPLLLSCGVAGPKHKETPTSKVEVILADTASTCGQNAIASFTENIQPAISSTCAGCHASGTGSGTLLMTASTPTSNRENLFRFTELDKEKIERKFKGVHSGGDLGDVLTKTMVNNWISEEEKCQ